MSFDTDKTNLHPCAYNLLSPKDDGSYSSIPDAFVLREHRPGQKPETEAVKFWLPSGVRRDTIYTLPAVELWKLLLDKQHRDNLAELIANARIVVRGLYEAQKALDNNNRLLDTQNKELERGKQSAENSVEDLTVRNSELQAEVRSLRHQIETLNQEISGIETSFKNWAKAQFPLIDVNSAYNKDLLNYFMYGGNRASNSPYTDKDRVIKDAFDNLNHTHRLNKVLKDKCITLEEQHKKGSREAQQRFEDEIKRLRAEVSRLEAETSKLPSKDSLIAELEQKVAELGDQFATAQQEAALTKEWPASLELLEKKMAAATIEASIDQLMSTVENLRAQYAHLSADIMAKGPDLPVIISKERIEKIKNIINELVQTFIYIQDPQDPNGGLMLQVANPMYEAAAKKLDEARELEENPVKLRDAYEAYMLALGQFQAAKQYENLVLDSMNGAQTNNDKNANATDNPELKEFKIKYKDWFDDSGILIDFYNLFDIDQDADETQIREAYHARMKAMHPDVGGISEEAASINMANDALTKHKDVYARAYTLAYGKKA